MVRTPANPKICHIVHEGRLPSIIRSGGLWCDQKMRRHKGGFATAIGDPDIKKDRLGIRLKCYTEPDFFVGACVPFYFCPRSVMLYKIYQGKVSSYQDGEEPIVYLVSDFNKAVDWAAKNRRRWAFTDTNARTGSAKHFNNRAELDKINWQVMSEWKQASRAATEPKYKAGKQAEFLVESSFAWNLISRIGVSSKKIRARVVQMLEGVAHHPKVAIEPGWYYGDYR